MVKVINVYKQRKRPGGILAGLMISNPLMSEEQEKENSKDHDMLNVTTYDPFWIGTVCEKDVEVKCVPKNDPWIQEHLGDLPIINAKIPIRYE
jgi:hypothetical protein